MSAPFVVAAGVGKRYGALAAVAELDLAVAAGEVLGVAGRNAAGKSTALAILAGVVEPDSGTVTVAGERLTRRRPALRRLVGFQPQEPAVYPDLTARDNLACFGGLYGLGAGELRRRVDELLDLTGLAAERRRPVRQLSGGMRRRLSFAASVLHRPRFLVLDEPAAGLDAEFRPVLSEIVRGMARDGAAVVWASHELAEASAAWDGIAVLERGRLLARDTVAGFVGRCHADVELVVDRSVLALAPRLVGLARLRPDGDGRALLVLGDGVMSQAEVWDRLARVIPLLRAEGVTMHAVRSREATLERAYAELVLGGRER